MCPTEYHSSSIDLFDWWLDNKNTNSGPNYQATHCIQYMLIYFKFTITCMDTFAFTKVLFLNILFFLLLKYNFWARFTGLLGCEPLYKFIGE